MKTLLLAITAYIALSGTAFAAQPAGTVYADVNGLVCDFCARAIEKVFKRQQAVESIDVDLDVKVITIHFRPGQSLDKGTITKMINDSGYDVRGLRYAD